MKIYVSAVMVLTIALSGCGPSEEEIAAQKAEEKAYSDKLRIEAAKKEDEENKLVDQELKKIKADDVRLILIDCEGAITRESSKNLKGIEGPTLVYGGEAEAYALFYKKISKNILKSKDERVKDYAEAMKKKGVRPTEALNMQYAVFRKIDSFSGLQPDLHIYTCRLLPGLKVDPGYPHRPL